MPKKLFPKSVYDSFCLDSGRLKISDFTLAHFEEAAKIPKLGMIALRGINLETQNLRLLIGCTELSSLNIRFNSPTTVPIEDLLFMGKMPQLNTVQFANILFTDDDMASFPAMPGLKHLEMCGSSLKGHGLKQLANKCPSIGSLSLKPFTHRTLVEMSGKEYYFSLDPSELADALSSFTKLKTLQLGDDNPAFAEAMKALPHIRLV